MVSSNSEVRLDRMEKQVEKLETAIYGDSSGRGLTSRISVIETQIKVILGLNTGIFVMTVGLIWKIVFG